MRLHVMRHAYAGEFSEDPKKERERPLTSEGRQMAIAVAKAMIDADEIPNIIFASPFFRTTQTADIIGKLLGVQVNTIDDLSPNRPIEDRLLELMSHKEQKRLMIVVHHDNSTPAFNHFAEDDNAWDPLVMAEVRRVKIDRDSGKWKLRWGVKPSDLGLKDYGVA